MSPSRSWFCYRLPCFAGLLFLLLFSALVPLPTGIPGALLAAAQPTEATATEEAAEGAGSAEAAQDVAPATERQSPRATMRTFLQAFDPEIQKGGQNLSQAAACLDLGNLPPGLRSTEGPKRAVELKVVIDRTRLVDFSTIPDDNEGEPFVFLRHEEGDVIIARQASGEWLFTEETVANLPALWRATRGEEMAEGVNEAQETLALWIRSQLPDSLLVPTLLLERWQWLGLGLLLAFGWLAGVVARWLVRGSLRRALERGWVKVDRPLLSAVLRPLGWLVMTAAWWIGLYPLDLPLQVTALLYYVLWTTLAVAVVWLGFASVDVLAAVLEARAARTTSRYDDLLVPLVRKSLKVVVALLGLIFALQNLGFNITSVLAGLGIGGLAFALASQDAVKNFFGSVTILLERPFQIGDWVVVGGVEGTVEEVGIRSTRVRTFYNSLITLPNASFITASVDNYGERRYRRWSTRLGIAYDTDPEAVEAFCEAVRELIRRHPYTRKDSYHVYLNAFGDSALEILLYMFFETPDWATELQERHRLALSILRVAKELGVEFAFPTRTVHLMQDNAASEDPVPGPAPDAAPALSGFRQRSDQNQDRARQLVAKLVDDDLGPTDSSSPKGE
ncbi:MAG: mechanosensitive ion channel family protein [Acidobacteriota bacterium]